MHELTQVPDAVLDRREVQSTFVPLKIAKGTPLSIMWSQEILFHSLSVFQPVPELPPSKSYTERQDIFLNKPTVNIIAFPVIYLVSQSQEWNT